jgi:hypothetical protein
MLLAREFIHRRNIAIPFILPVAASSAGRRYLSRMATNLGAQSLAFANVTNKDSHWLRISK